MTASELDSELAREVPPGTFCTTCTPVAVAVRRHLKEIVFWLPESEQWAWIHLAWRAEADPRGPSAVVESEWSALLQPDV